MTVPRWLESILSEYGRQLGLKNFGVAEKGAAVLRFENGSALRFEYAMESLVMALEIPVQQPSPVVFKRLLAYARPERRKEFTVRSAYMEKKDCALFAIRVSEHDITLPLIVSASTELMQLAEDFRNRI
ncbi:MAG: hypothetical protein MJ106_00765 [Lentisphaeria bacterium]|nr:hypothetical protein [Lentisphaeria bacterium]